MTARPARAPDPVPEALRRARRRWVAQHQLRAATVLLPAILALLLAASWGSGVPLGWGWLVASTLAVGLAGAWGVGLAAAPSLEETARWIDRQLAAEQTIETAFDLRRTEGDVAGLVRRAAGRLLRHADTARLGPPLWSRPPRLAWIFAVTAALALLPHLGVLPPAAELLDRARAQRPAAGGEAGDAAVEPTPLPAGLSPPEGRPIERPGAADPEAAGPAPTEPRERRSAAAPTDPAAASQNGERAAGDLAGSPSPPPAAGDRAPRPGASAPDTHGNGATDLTAAGAQGPRGGGGQGGGGGERDAGRGSAGASGGGSGSGGGEADALPGPSPLRLDGSPPLAAPGVEEAIAAGNLPPGLELYVRRYFEALARPR